MSHTRDQRPPVRGRSFRPLIGIVAGVVLVVGLIGVLTPTRNDATKSVEVAKASLASTPPASATPAPPPVVAAVVPQAPASASPTMVAAPVAPAAAAPTVLAQAPPASAPALPAPVSRPDTPSPPAAAPSADPRPAVASPPAPAALGGQSNVANPNSVVSPSLAQAKTSMKIQQVKSPGGIEAWLVEEHSVPLLAMRYVFDGGNAQDPDNKVGVANFLTAMLDEGAAELTSEQFQERMEELAARISFEDSRDSFFGNFETLTVNREPSVELLKLALTKPRFDADAVERIRQQLLAGIAFAAKSPDKVASKAWSATAFPNHPYGRPAEGTAESIASITRDDLEAFRRRIFAKDTLRVVAVGDIDATQLASLLDTVFGDLPAKADLVPVAKTEPKPVKKLEVIEMDVPQSVVQFGMNGVHRKDPDFIPAFVLNQVLGGGGFASRLTEEVREKRGLAYSVYSYLQPYRHVAIFGGGVATKNEEVARSLEVIRGELKRMAEEGLTAEELVNAKSYLTGSFALRFDTNAKIASQLIWMLQEDMGIDYVERRNALIDAVTLEDIRRVAKRLLTVDDLIVTVAGKPKGLVTSN